MTQPTMAAPVTVTVVGVLVAVTPATFVIDAAIADTAPATEVPFGSSVSTPRAGSPLSVFQVT